MWELASYIAISEVSVALMACASHYYSAFSWDVSFAVPCLIVILALTISPQAPLAKLLSLPVIVSLGEISYAFYLVHLLAHPMLNLSGATLPVALGRYGMFLGFVICLSYGLHVVVERPARGFFKNLQRSKYSIPGSRLQNVTD